MFKAFKEKVSNEYEKAKVNIQSQALNLVKNEFKFSFYLFIYLSIYYCVIIDLY